VSQFTERAEPVHRLGRYVEVCSDLLDRQQRPQPVRRILGERCKNLRSPGIRARLIPSSCKRLRKLATPCKPLARPSKSPAGGSSPSKHASLRRCCRRAARLPLCGLWRRDSGREARLCGDRSCQGRPRSRGGAPASLLVSADRAPLIFCGSGVRLRAVPRSEASLQPPRGLRGGLFRPIAAPRHCLRA